MPISAGAVTNDGQMADEEAAMHKGDDGGAAQRWARLRLSVIGPLLASPPRRGQLQQALARLSETTWTHPTTGAAARFGLSTIERWYYLARNELRDPIGVLRRRVRSDAGTQPSLSDALRAALRQQYAEHPGWSVQLHYDNLVVVAEEHKLARVPSYTTVRRRMRSCGLRKVRPKSRRKTPGTERAARRLERREVRSYEATHVHGLWHADFHEGSRHVLLPTGERAEVRLFGTLDDHSRLCCHLQWYLGEETTESFVHGLSQALQKRALPRALMTDNGSAMLAGETQAGLEQLSITHDPTLSESPYQNGKQEAFWTQIEIRLLPMLEGVDELTLDLLNEASQAWVELEYNRTRHDEIDTTPLRRYLDAPNVGRDSPDSDTLRRAFRLRVWRHQRRSDGTVSIEGRRFELPSRFRQQRRVLLRYARWDLSLIDVVDPRTDTVLAPIYPLDKAKNADGRRRTLEPLPTLCQPPGRRGEIAPLLRKLIQQYAATGLPPAYLPKREENDGDAQDPDTEQKES